AGDGDGDTGGDHVGELAEDLVHALSLAVSGGDEGESFILECDCLVHFDSLCLPPGRSRGDDTTLTHDLLELQHSILPVSGTLVSLGIERETSGPLRRCRDRKSTRLNFSHVSISYAVFCLKKKKKE